MHLDAGRRQHAVEHFRGGGADEALVAQLHESGPGGLVGHAIIGISGLMS